MPQKSHVLVRRDSRIPYFRRSIPETLRPQLGRSEFICSLRTSEPPEVAARANALLAKTEELLCHARSLSAAGRMDCAELAKAFDRYRDAICSGQGDISSTEAVDDVAESYISRGSRPRRKSSLPPRHHLFRPSMTARLLARHRAVVLAGDDTWRRTLKPTDLARCRADFARREQGLIDDIALNNLENAWPGAWALLDRECVDFSRAPLPAMLSFVESYLREELDLVRIRIARLNGADIPSLSHLLVRWMRTSGPSWHRCGKRFEYRGLPADTRLPLRSRGCENARPTRALATLRSQMACCFGPHSSLSYLVGGLSRASL
jgi:hypothetical protein